jgi:uncharacterized protein involved in exopolysaccharide biosynthesis
VLQTVPQDEIIIDGARLRQAFRRQGRLWLWLGPVSAAVGVLLLGALVPRSYTATTSVALQQSSGGSSPLALLTGGGSTSKRYLGILKSRALAETVERHAQLRQLYGTKTFPTEEDAVEFLAKNIKPDDSSPDGLLYIAVTLPGPPKFALHPSPSVSQVEAVSADAANDYARALKIYYATSDTDQGAVLLRGADKEVRESRASYNDALARSLDFTRSLSGVDPRSAPLPSSASSSADSLSLGSTSAGGVSSGGGTDAATAASGLGPLYTALNQVEAELSSVQASQTAGQQLVGNQLRDLSNVPTDDPLLANARSRVTQDQMAYDAAFKLFGPENPAVITAQARLEVDRAELNRQVQGVKHSLTTPDIRTTEQITGLNARRVKLIQQIADAERHLGVSRKLSGEAGRLQAEVGIQLDVLKTTLTEAAKIRLDNAAALNRMTVVDPAIPPKSGEPGLGKLAAICLLLAFLAFLAAVVHQYLRTAATAQSPVLPPARGANGSGTLSAEDKEAAALQAAPKQ